MVAQKSSLQKITENPYKLINILDKCGLSKFIPDKEYLQIKYRACIGKKLDLLTPKTFNEKLQWLKLNDRKPVYSTLVDKYLVKKYVASLIGEEHIIPTLGVWDSFDDIDFSSLPDQFVLKCTHDSGGLVICRNIQDLNIDLTRKKINSCLKNNYYNIGREWPYKEVQHRIIAEPFIEDKKTNELRDYKIHCFNGSPKFILVCGNRFGEGGLEEDFFDTQWNHLDCKRPKHKMASASVDSPIMLNEMIEFSKILSRGIPFIRVDFYEVNGATYFGELTFYPASGFEKFDPEEFDLIFGSYLDIGV